MPAGTGTETGRVSAATTPTFCAVTPGLQIRTSHQLETLLQALARDLAAAPLPPLALETIIVPGQGIARWLQLQLAQRHGIAASLQLPFPGAFLQRLCRATAVGAGGDPFDRPVLAWRIFRLLGEARLQRGLDKAARYCKDDDNQQKRWQLAQRLADCFDDYQLYRDDLLLQFESGELPAKAGPHAAWQALLWRELLQDAGATTEAAPADGLLFRQPAPAVTGHRLQRLRQLLQEPARARALLPSRLSVFGTGTLPPAFVDLLVRCAALLPVTLYLQRPTPYYFGDLGQRDAAAPLGAGEGNALLQACGQQVRGLFDLLLERDLGSGADDALPTPEPDGDGLLATLQRDLLHLAVRGDGGDVPRQPLQPADASLRIHDCHSPLREMEVLRDQLLAAIDADPELQPHDILVLLPDVRGYAPFVHAVFDPLQDRLPFHVADRSPAAALPLAATLLEVLQLAGDRVDAASVLHCLEEAAVLRAFALAPKDLPALREWVQRARIRWGIDAAQRRRSFDLPEFTANSWEQGLERLLLGHATGALDELCLGILPAADATGARAEVLARFLDFTATLFAHLRALGRPHTLTVWAELTEALLADLFVAVEPDEMAALQAVRAAVARLRQHGDLGAVREEVTPMVWRRSLELELEQLSQRGGFLTGAVTFAALQPLRLVPVPVLAIVGLGDGAFPRRDRAAAFDLIAAAPRRGDPGLRSGDRQLFLDALQAARRQLILTFVGHSQKDDSERAPSVVLAELLDHIDRGFAPPPGCKRARDHVLVRHPLQAFSPRYRSGEDARLFTYAIAEAAAPAALPPLPALPRDDEAAAAPAPVLPLVDLLAFWRHPARHYCKRVLQLQLLEDNDRELDTEPFRLHALDRYQVQDRALRHWLGGHGQEPLSLPLLAASGCLPPGAGGAVEAADLDADAHMLLARLQHHAAFHTVAVDLAVGGRRLTGSIDFVTAAALLCWRPASIKKKDKLRAWILHSCLNAMKAQGQDVPVDTLLVGRREQSRLLPMCTDAKSRLEDLLAGYDQGMTSPLPFFENASHDFAKAIGKGQDRDDLLRRLRSDWLDEGAPMPNYRPAGDGQDGFVALCWRDREPLGDDFVHWAQRIWAPLLTMLCEEDEA